MNDCTRLSSPISHSLFVSIAATDADLTDLSFEDTETSTAYGLLEPSTFDAAVVEYLQVISTSVTSIDINAPTSNSGASVTYNGQASSVVSISAEENEITVVVTAEQGNTKTYTLFVYRLPDSETRLRSVETTPSIFSIDSETLGDTFSFSQTVSPTTTGVSFKALAFRPDSTVEVQGTEVAYGDFSSSISLRFRNNDDLTVRVTSPDGTASRDYLFSIYRTCTYSIFSYRFPNSFVFPYPCYFQHHKPNFLLFVFAPLVVLRHHLNHFFTFRQQTSSSLKKSIRCMEISTFHRQ